MATIKKEKKNEFYAESLLFQSPDPSELPMPIFDKQGRMVSAASTTPSVANSSPSKVDKTVDVNLVTNESLD